AARLWYFHDWLPNTYYLKVAGSRAIDRWMRGGMLLATHLVRELAMPAGLAALSPALRTRQGRLLAAIAAGQMAYSIHVGGDPWDWMIYATRFVSIGVPLLIVLAATTIADPAVGRWLDRPRGIHAIIAWGLAGVLFPAGVRDGFWLGTLSPFDRTLLYTRLAATAGALAIGARAAFATVRFAAQPRDRGAPSGPARFSVAWQSVALIIALSGSAAVGWWSTGGAHVRDDELMVRVGIDLQALTRPDASIALTWAGSVPYFSRRPAVDLLGKSDPVIARSPRHGFRPGHDKWDGAHSIRDLRPDLILQLASTSEGELAALAGWGYVPLPLARTHPLFDLYIREDTTAVDRNGLAGALARRFGVR